MKWSVALGSLKNGTSAGALSVIDAAASDWNSIFTPAELYYESSSNEVFVYRVNGNIRQVSANAAFVDVVTLSTTAYELRFYHAASAQGSAYPKTFAAVPFVTYRVQQGASPTQVTITKEIRNLSSVTDMTAPIARSETTTLTRTGTFPAFTWARSDWTLTGETPLSQEIREWTANASGGHDETITIVDGGGSVVRQAFRAHTHFDWGDTLTTVTTGVTAPATDTYAYNADTADLGSYGFVSSQRTNGGNWRAYTYFDTSNPLQLGTIRETFQPFLNAPATVGTSATDGVMTTYAYAADAFGMLTRPTSIQTQVNGVAAGDTTIAYSTATANGMTVVVATRSDKASPAGPALTSVTSYYQENTGDDFFRGQVHAIISPNGTKQSYVRQRGTLNDATFTPGASGKATRIGVITGAATATAGATALSSYAGYTIDTVYLIPGKSTFDVTCRDNYARIARTESYVWDGSAWQTVNWVNCTYNCNNQLVSRISSNGDDYEVGYVGDLKTWERDDTGVTVTYDYDVAGRLLHATKTGLNGSPDLVTTYTYDADGRVTGQSVSAAGGSERLATTRAYDLAGRLISETVPGAGPTAYSYDPVNLTTTVTRPDGSTQIQALYADGQLASRTGTGIVPEYYTYSLQADGQKITQVNLATPVSPRMTQTWSDWLGRTTRTERPGFSGTGLPALYEQNIYDATTGLLTRTDRSAGAAVLYQYDALGNLTLSGLDVNGNGVLDLAGPDRVSGQDKGFVNEDGAWWLASTRTAYVSDASDAPVVLGSTRRRLTGFTGGLRDETRETDAEGNTTVQTVSVDPATATTTRTTTLPGLASPQVDILVNGLIVSSTAPDGLTTTIAYDGLGRPVSSVDPRTGATTTTYVNGTALPATITDPAGITVATCAYDSMGRKVAATDAQNHTTRRAYDSLGHVLRQWGDGTHPASYGYNAYGERVALSTYQTEYGWDAATWPAAAVPAGTTTWDFDEPSGLLVRKTDSSGHSVEYDYDSDGRLSHRYWARTLDGTPGADRVTITCGYDDATGETTSVTYNDGTPAVITAYNRAGRVASITDATGTRQFTYDAASPWRRLAERLPASFQNRVLTELYEETTSAGTLKGRSRGFQLGVAGNPASLLTQTNTLDSLGRLSGITSTDGNASQGFTYAYTAGSRLVQSWAALGTGFATTRSYEPHRNLLTGIDSTWDAASRGRFTYDYDSLARRETSLQDGDAFADYGEPLRHDYAYDARGELISAHASLGTTGGPPLPGRQFDYAYDAAGNLLSANRTGDTAQAETCTPNALNQLVARTSRPGLHVAGTADTDVSVAVGDQLATRADRYWHAFLPLDNSAGPAGRLFAITAARPGGGSGGADLVDSDFRFGFLYPAAETFTYDDDGNLLSDGRWSYTWDAENRLVSMQTRDGAVLTGGPPRQHLDFTYDYLGRRVVKTVHTYDTATSQWLPAQETRFLYDGWNLLAETTATGALIRTYTWGLDLTGSVSAAGGVGALLQISDHQTGLRYFPACDGNGNVVALVKALTGTVAAAYEYSPFGEVMRHSGDYAAANPLRFGSKYLDAETGLLDYGHRYYDARNGRFINRDPIDERGGLNLYGFCGNDGVNHWDYLGYSWLSKAIKSIGKAVSDVGKFITKNWKPIVAVVASIVTYGMASGLVAGTFAASSASAAAAAYGGIGTAAGDMVAAMSAAAYVPSTFAAITTGIAGGAAAGAAAGGIMTGSLKGTLQGAAAGSIMGGIAGYYDGTWTPSRVGVTTVGGGLASEVSGGSFRQGALISGAAALVTYGAIKMREFTVAQSKLDPRNASGQSVGFNGDGFKAGGGRFDERIGARQIESPLGGIQGGQGLIKMPLIGRIEYTAGSFLDRVVEAYSGVHDWLNNPWSYNPATGNYNPQASFFGRNLEEIGISASKAASFMNAVDVPLATPIVAASVAQIYIPNYISIYNQSKEGDY